jgi:ribonuclease D
MSNWERRPLRQSQQHYGALDAWIMIDIVKALIQKAKNDKLSPFNKFVKTLDNRKIIITADIDSDDMTEDQKTKYLEEKINIASNSKSKNKRQRFDKKDGEQTKAYGNSYGHKG